jgi:NAD(P)-dependent dehydrogenase (short-subunit alcohol dehydrogenase family)
VNAPIRDWRDKRVWIVGASSGIGAALAEALLEQGAAVAISARSADKLDRIADRRERAWPLPLDATSEQQLAAAWQQIVARWGGVDLVVCMAGTYVPLRAWELAPEVIRSTVETNLTSAMLIAATVLPRFLERGTGALALVASVAGFRGLPKAVVYGPTKAALINFAEALHLDLAPKGISVFLINPGFVATPLTAKNDFRMPALIGAPQAAQRILQGLARGRFEIHFPRRFTLALKLLACLPYPLYFRIVGRMTGL